MKRSLIVAVVLVLVGVVALPAFADVSAADVAQARNALREVGVRLEEQLAAYDEALAAETALGNRLDALVVALETRESELVQARLSARDRAASMYMSAGSAVGSAGVVSTDDMIHAPARYVYLTTVSETDREVVNRLEAARRDFEQQKLLLNDAYAEQADLRVEMDTLIGTIYAELEAANSEYQTVKARWEKQERERIARELFLATSTTTTTTTRPRVTTTAASGIAGTTVTTTATAPATVTTVPVTTPPTVPPIPVPSGTMVCPVDGATTFRDSWGDPRSGGRTHKGVDMMAARWTPLVAIETGSIYRISNDSLGGLGIYVHGESGALWYYAHNEAIADGITTGSPVVAGQRIAYVGSSGNASYNYPHVHFAWIPRADWVYANPYPIVAPLCR